MSGSCIPEQCRQIVVTLAVNMLSIYMGVFFGWTIVDDPLTILRKYSPMEETFNMSEDESEMSTPSRALMFLCILAALPVTVFISELYGRKAALGLNIIPFLIYAGARSTAGRFSDEEPERRQGSLTMATGAMTCAMQLYLVPIYVNEISSYNKRGAHGVIRTLFIGTGMYLGYAKTSIWLEPAPLIVNLVIPLVYMLMTRLIPESPVWLSRRGRANEAERVRAWLGKEGASLTETQIARCFDIPRHGDETESVGFVAMFNNSDVLRGLSVICALLIGQALLQISCIGGYFIISRIPMSAILTPNTIIPFNVTLHVLICLVAARTIDRIGRRKLLVISCAGMFTALCIISAYRSTIEKNFADTKNTVTLFVTLVILAYLIFYFLGMGSIPVIVALEIIPDNVMHYGYLISLVCFWLITGIVGAWAEDIVMAIGITSSCIIQATVCLLLFFVVWIMPETKPKAVHNIVATEEF